MAPGDRLLVHFADRGDGETLNAAIIGRELRLHDLREVLAERVADLAFELGERNLPRRVGDNRRHSGDLVPLDAAERRRATVPGDDEPVAIR